jgi:RHS repeat-associated protein
MAYDLAARLTGLTRKTSTDVSAPHVDTTLSYNARNLLKTITHTSSAAGALATFSYSYDAGARLINSSGPEGSLTYTYDQVAQLTGVTGARTENYSYDLNGNRTMTGYSPPAAGNRLTSDGTYNYTYDNEGNLLTKTLIADTTQQTLFTWDYRNRLTEVVVKSGPTTLQDDRFTYDVANRRIGKWTNGTQQWTVYDGANPYADFNSSGSLTYRYLYGPSSYGFFARFDGTNTVWYLRDMAGSVRLLVNTNGVILDQVTYDSYGKILTESSPTSGDRFKYTGQEWDGEIGLQHNWARYYNPAIGRWTNEDPTGFNSGDANLYRYVVNNPVTRVDPSGLAWVWPWDDRANWGDWRIGEAVCDGLVANGLPNSGKLGGALSGAGIGSVMGALGAATVVFVALTPIGWGGGVIILAGAGAGMLVGSGYGAFAGSRKNTLHGGAVAAATDPGTYVVPYLVGGAVGLQGAYTVGMSRIGL